jgi:GTPase
MSSLVAIVGRPNVGKSTLFNRLTESRKAIVDEMSGVTRDRHYGEVEWSGRVFSIVDTGGYISGSDDVFESEIRKQVQIAIDEADAVLCIVDVTTGVTDLDETVAALLRKSDKKIMLAVNKVDNNKREQDVYEFYSLGLGEPFSLSSINGSGTGELLDGLLEIIPEKEQEDTTGVPKIAIIGQPNVGKSSLLNTILGEERTIVTPIAGTTRDIIHTRFKGFGFDFLMIDTAGLRKKAKVKEDIEFYSVIRTIKAIEESDVCMLLIDAVEGVDAQTLKIFHLAHKNHKGIVIVVNKWDLIEKGNTSTKDYDKNVRERIAPFSDVPIIFTSVPQKQRVLKAIETAIEVYKNRQEKVSTALLNKLLLPIIENQPPPALKGKFIKIKYITQIPGYYPQFAFFCNHPQYIKEPYKRFLENKIRENFTFTGVPIEIYFRSKS